MQELPPGLVSIEFEAPQPAATNRISGRVRGQLRRHAWTDPQLQRIAAYQREAGLEHHQDAERQANGAASCSAPMPATDTANRTADADIGAAGQPDGAAAAGSSEAAMATEPQAESQTAASPSERPPDPQALSQAAAKLLRVLAEAVRVRCLAADEVAGDRRAAELAAACDPSSELHVSFSTAASCENRPQPSRDTSGSSSAGSHAHMAHASADGLPHSSTAAMCERDACQNGAHRQSCKHTSQPAHAKQSCGHLPPAPVLVLFSGGVDSTLLAALAHQVYLNAGMYQTHDLLLWHAVHLANVLFLITWLAMNPLCHLLETCSAFETRCSNASKTSCARMATGTASGGAY